MTRVQVDFKHSKEIEKALQKAPKNLEEKINNYLHTKGSKAVMENIIKFIPKSKRNKKHAKDKNPLKIDIFNLGFEVYAKGGAANKKGSYGYLVFPDQGIGPHNFVAQEFFRRGLESKEDKLFNDILKIIDETL